MLKKIKTYTVWDSKTGKTFSSLSEAKNYEREYRSRTGNFVSITEGTKAVTYTFKQPFKKKVKPSWVKK